MKKIITLVALLGLVVSASAQFRSSSPVKVDVLGGTPVVLAASGSTTISTSAYIGKDGFTVTPYFVGTNSGTANLAILAVPVGDGVNSNSTAATALGNVAMNGTTAVRGSVFTAGTTFAGTGLVKIVLTNAHTAILTISNVTVSAW
jgi:hypothetical protein